MRIEKDFLSDRELPEDVLYGIHSLRAKENFPDNTPFHIEWYKATGLVKLACYHTYATFKKAALEYKQIMALRFMDDAVLNALVKSALEVSEGKYFEYFIVPAIQGGAGTSINLNINEIIANRALTILGYKPGNYAIIDPIEQANVYQSTNDVIPTSLKITVMQLLKRLEEKINLLRYRVEELEKLHRDSLRMGYTQMQEAVPSSYGRLFSTYSEALSRDWWRVSKCFERIKVVNMGGGAIGSGLSVPVFFIMEVVQELQRLTHLPITRGENLYDATCNLDSFVEVHAILKSHAVNLEKMVSDIRLLASDITGLHEVEIPKKQVGSSIMPGKINPVIPEFVISVAHKVYANDSLVTSLCSQSCLELNAYIPVIGHAIIESLKILIAANDTLKANLFDKIKINVATAQYRLLHSPAITTALTPFIGYHKASELAKEMKENSCNIFEANQKMKLMNDDQLKKILQPQNLLKLGYSIKDLE
ncbi:MAG: lyase family protein [Bacteroidales bacterium]|nr:lyase family protein [Bacteroidales bacterium]